MKPSLGSHGTRLGLLFATLILMASCSKNATKPDAPPQADFYVNATTGLDGNPGTSPTLRAFPRRLCRKFA